MKNKNIIILLLIALGPFSSVYSQDGNYQVMRVGNQKWTYNMSDSLFGWWPMDRDGVVETNKGKLYTAYQCLDICISIGARIPTRADLDSLVLYLDAGYTDMSLDEEIRFGNPNRFTSTENLRKKFIRGQRAGFAYQNGEFKALGEAFSMWIFEDPLMIFGAYNAEIFLDHEDFHFRAACRCLLLDEDE